MQWVRTGRVARSVAMFFLLWTGVDLLNPSLCAIDRQADSRSARAESTALTTTGSTQPAPSGSAEDCFCCCHHVVSTTMWAPIPQADLTKPVTLPPVKQIRVFRTRLDHPPRLV